MVSNLYLPCTYIVSLSTADKLKAFQLSRAPPLVPHVPRLTRFAKTESRRRSRHCTFLLSLCTFLSLPVDTTFSGGVRSRLPVCYLYTLPLSFERLPLDYFFSFILATTILSIERIWRPMRANVWEWTAQTTRARSSVRTARRTDKRVTFAHRIASNEAGYVNPCALRAL